MITNEHETVTLGGAVHPEAKVPQVQQMQLDLAHY